MQYTTEDVAEEGDEMSIAKKIAKQHAFIGLRDMKYRTYESDHDFYEQLKKAIGYTGATYDGVCMRLIELMDDRALELKMEALGEVHKRTMEALATAEARIEKLETELRYAQKVSAERDEAADWVEAHGGIDELDKRLMPDGMEWPRFEDGERVEFGSAVDGLDSPCEKFIFTRSMGGVCQLQDADGDMVNVIHGERVKRPEVLAADGLPIKVGETVYGTGREQDVYKVTSMDKSKAQGRFAVECIGNGGETCMVDPSQLTHIPPDTQKSIDDDAHKVSDPCTYFSSDGSCAKCRFVSQYGDADSAYEACPKSVELERMAILDLLCRQRELDASTMGGE